LDGRLRLLMFDEHKGLKSSRRVERHPAIPVSTLRFRQPLVEFLSAVVMGKGLEEWVLLVELVCKYALQRRRRLRRFVNPESDQLNCISGRKDSLDELEPYGLTEHVFVVRDEVVHRVTHDCNEQLVVYPVIGALGRIANDGLYLWSGDGRAGQLLILAEEHAT